MASASWPAYHPAMLLKLYVYGYLNKVQSSRRLEREAQRNVELMWLTGRLAPDHKTIADFRRENGPAIQAACAQFVVLCRELGLFGAALVAIDGSKFKAVNTRDRNFTAYKVKRRIEQVAEHIAGYLQDLDTADRHEGEAAEARSDRLAEKIERLRAQMAMLKTMEAQVEASPDGQVSLTDPDARSMATSGRGSGIVGYNVQSAVEGEHHLIVAHEVVMTGSDREQLASMAGKAKDAMGVDALDVLADRGYFSGEEILACEAMRVRRRLVEHPFGTIKAWMGHTHFLMKRLPNVKTEISLHILAYNMKRVMAVLGTKPLMEAIRA
jgi:transposase